jgi:hypothetical protein
VVKRRDTIRSLRALVADPERVRNLRVAAGAVDGFVAAEAAGIVVEAAVPPAAELR